MRNEKFLVTATVGGITRSFPWNPEESLALDPQKQWHLEALGEELVIRQSAASSRGSFQRTSTRGSARNVQSKPTSKDVIVTRTKRSALTQDESQISTDKVQVRIKTLRPIPPAYSSASSQSLGSDVSKRKTYRNSFQTPDQDQVQQFLIFSGIGGLLKGSQAAKSIYLAYARGIPIFTVSFDENESQVKALYDGVKFKLKGEKAQPAPVGELISVKTQDLLTATVIRGSRWWRFGKVSVAESLPEAEGFDFESADEELRTASLIKTLLWLLGGVALLGIILWLIPSPEKKVEEIKEVAPVVRIKVPHKRFVAAPKAEAIAQSPAPVAVSKPQVAPKPPAPAPAAAPKRGAVAKTTPVRNQSENSSQKAAAQLGALRSAFKDALTLTQKDVAAPRVGAKGSQNIFNNAKGGSVAATKIAPGYSSNSGTKTAGMGSSGYADGSGYAQADRSRAAGSGAEFVGVGEGEPDVDEGLSKEEVGEVIHRHMSEIRACHESAMLYQPRISGRLLVRFLINPQGRVSKASVEESDLSSDFLQNCILKKIPRWAFPKPKNGVSVSVAYPFLFKTLRR